MPGVWLKARIGARLAYRFNRKTLKMDHVAINQIVIQHHLGEKTYDRVINSYRVLNQSLSVSCPECTECLEVQFTEFMNNVIDLSLLSNIL